MSEEVNEFTFEWLVSLLEANLLAVYMGFYDSTAIAFQSWYEL